MIQSFCIAVSSRCYDLKLTNQGKIMLHIQKTLYYVLFRRGVTIAAIKKYLITFKQALTSVIIQYSFCFWFYLIDIACIY